MTRVTRCLISRLADAVERESGGDPNDRIESYDEVADVLREQMPLLAGNAFDRIFDLLSAELNRRSDRDTPRRYWL